MSLGFILCEFGFQFIDQNLSGLLEFMNDFPQQLMGNTMSLAKTVGLLIALCVGSYECWMMMLGRRGMDVMKIARIIGISICISLSSSICNMAWAPGHALEQQTHAIADAIGSEVDAKIYEMKEKQKIYNDSVVVRRARAFAKAHALQSTTDDKGVLEIVSESWDYLKEMLGNMAKDTLMWIDATLSDLIRKTVRLIAEMFFQMTFYFVMIGQRILKTLLTLFCPLCFAMSLAPPFSNAWSQWLSKYISVSLWGFVAYLVIYYSDYMMLYFIQMDINQYCNYLSAQNPDEYMEVANGIQLGSCVFIAIGYLISSMLLMRVPEFSSMLIPGGVSTSGDAQILRSISGTTSAVSAGTSAVTTGVHVIQGVKKLGSGALSKIKNN